MTKGWYGDKIRHGLASKGIRTNMIAYGKGIDFEKWKKYIDTLSIKYIGIDIDSLPDFSWYVYYDQRFTPLEAFQIYIEDNIDMSFEVKKEILESLEKENHKIYESMIRPSYKRKMKVSYEDKNGMWHDKFFDDVDSAREHFNELVEIAEHERGLGDDRISWITNETMDFINKPMENFIQNYNPFDNKMYTDIKHKGQYKEE